jgi:hypothetical protein
VLPSWCDPIATLRRDESQRGGVGGAQGQSWLAPRNCLMWTVGRRLDEPPASQRRQLTGVPPGPCVAGCAGHRSQGCRVRPAVALGDLRRRHGRDKYDLPSRAPGVLPSTTETPSYVSSCRVAGDTLLQSEVTNGRPVPTRRVAGPAQFDVSGGQAHRDWPRPRRPSLAGSVQRSPRRAAIHRAVSAGRRSRTGQRHTSSARVGRTVAPWPDM